jgi:hypothetical protein
MRVAERFEHAGERVSEANHLTADVLNKAQSAGSSLSCHQRTRVCCC